MTSSSPSQIRPAAHENKHHVQDHEVDALYEEARLVVEMDGYAFHRTRRAFEQDRRRDASLLAAGYRVMRITYRQLDEEPEAVVVRLATALAR